MTDTTAVYAEIVKHERDANGDLVVYGRATGPDLDLDRQICDPAWLKSAMPTWFQTGANLREQHSSIAAGVGTEISEKPDGGWDLKALVVDPTSARKVERGVLKGYSVGIRSPRVVKDASAPGGRIVGGEIVEVSLVDRPANPTCTLTLAKALKPGPVVVAPGTVDHDRMLVKVEELHEAPADTRDLAKRDFSAGERRDAAHEGQAMADGSFPIKNEQDLKNAIRLAGNAKDPAKAKAHIKRRARALGLADRIPDTWKAAEALDLLKSYDLVAVQKGNTAQDVADAQQAIALIAGLIQSEAACLADGMSSEACDIDLLLGAAKALQYFIDRENQEPTMAHVELSDTPDAEKAAAPAAAPLAPSTGPAAELGKSKKKPFPPKDDDESTDDEDNDDDEDDSSEKSTTPDLTELVKAAVAEAIAPLQERLAKAEAAPQAGGPVLTRTAQDITKAAAREGLLAKATEYEQRAYELTGADRDAYLALAAETKAAATTS